MLFPQQSVEVHEEEPDVQQGSCQSRTSQLPYIAQKTECCLGFLPEMWGVSGYQMGQHIDMREQGEPLISVFSYLCCRDRRDRANRQFGVESLQTATNHAGSQITPPMLILLLWIVVNGDVVPINGFICYDGKSEI